MAKRWFVTGTDTGVGKTYVSCGLLQALARLGLATIALKPVASGCELTHGEWRNEDALALQAAASVQLPYAQVNPIALPRAVAPHIAASENGQALSVAELNRATAKTFAKGADVHLIEGAGGWLVPLNERETIADWVESINADVILVVGMRLGCINHALLSYQAIRAMNLNCIAWVANCIDPAMPALRENLATLKTRLPVPLLGVISYQAPAASQLDLGLLQRLCKASAVIT